MATKVAAWGLQKNHQANDVRRFPAAAWPASLGAPLAHACVEVDGQRWRTGWWLSGRQEGKGVTEAFGLWGMEEESSPGAFWNLLLSECQWLTST